MAAPSFRLTSTWLLAADREAVYDTVADAERWPEWWPGLISVERVGFGDRDGIGEAARFTWRASIGYRVGFVVTTTQRERPSLLEAQVEGDLAGTGRWRFQADGTATEVRYEWDVVTTGRLRSAAARLARPLAVREHDRLMSAGARGLAAHLGCELLAGG